MSDEEDLVEGIEAEEAADEAMEPDPKIQDGSIDARRKLEAKLEEVRLQKMTQEYDF